MISRIALLILATLLVLSCGGRPVTGEQYSLASMLSCATPTAGRPVHSPDIRLAVDTSDPNNHRLVVDSGPGCGGGSTDIGCVSMPQNMKGSITFMLKNGKNQDCTGSAVHGYKLLGMELSEEADKNFSDTVSAQVQCDFDTNAEGEVQASNKSYLANMMTVQDQNMNPLTNPYFVWYKVSAVSCTSGNVISTDPWIENKGTNPNR